RKRSHAEHFAHLSRIILDHKHGAKYEIVKSELCSNSNNGPELCSLWRVYEGSTDYAIYFNGPRSEG
ncbi:hypothetical protein L9F63_016008, partial [Diploptera punctata]